MTHPQQAPVGSTDKAHHVPKDRVVAIVDADEYDRLLELAVNAADAETAVIARRELEETAATPIPWDEVKAELGLK